MDNKAKELDENNILGLVGQSAGHSFDSDFRNARPTTPTPVAAPAPAQPAPTPGAETAPAPTTPQSPMYEKGLRDRTTWEQWVSSLTGNYRGGAEYWAGQRSLLNHGSCKSSDTVFQAGCEAATERLASVDVLRKSEPDYKLGWNAFGK
jgi:hypothetical protein